MSSESPISEGFRRAFREPAIVLAEIAWRWSFAVAVSALAIGSVAAYLDTFPISNAEVLALGRQPRWLIAATLKHLLHGGPLLLRIASILVPGMLVLWIAAAGVGRAATLQAMLRCEGRVAILPQLGLTFLRAGVTLASLVGFFGVLVLTGRAAAYSSDTSSGLFVGVVLLLGAAIAMLRSRINWFLSLAAIPAAREGCDTLTSIGEAVALFRRQRRKFTGAGAICAALHGVLFVFATVVCLFAVSLVSSMPPAGPLLVLTLVTLGYFVAVNFLFIARLAAHVAIDERDRTPPVTVVASESPPPAPEPPPMPASEPLVET